MAQAPLYSVYRRDVPASDFSHRVHPAADCPLAGVVSPIPDAQQPECVLSGVDAAGLAAVASATLDIVRGIGRNCWTERWANLWVDLWADTRAVLPHRI